MVLESNVPFLPSPFRRPFRVARFMASSTAYPVRPSKGALQDLTALSLPGRDPRLPSLYRYRGHHPLRPLLPVDSASSGRTFVYFVDGDNAIKAAVRELEDQFDVPIGRIATMDKKSPGTKPSTLPFPIS